MTTFIAATAFLLVGQTATYDASDIVQKGIKDISFTARVEYGNQMELAKINKDFGDSYRVSYSIIKTKEPFKVRVEGKVGDTTALYILNGTKRVYSIPRLKLRQKEDVSKGPGKRQTYLDFGLITPSLVEDLFDATFVRVDRATNDLVFDLTYKKNDKSRHRVWVDPKKKIVTKREWYNQKGKQLATFTYEKPVEIDGIWMSTLATVRNVDNKKAGVLSYENIKVNQGISDSLFDVD